MQSWSSKKKSVAAATALAAAVALLAGCSASAPAGPQTISFVTYTGGDAGKKYVDLISAFEAKNPDIKVDMQVVPGDKTYDPLIKSRIQGGSAPDLFEILNGIPGEKPYADAGLLTNLSDQAWVKTLIPPVKRASGFFSDKTYQFITQINSVGVFYNKDIFDKNGVKVPTNWAEFKQAIGKFNSAGVVPLATGAKDGWPLAVQALAMAANESGFAPGSADAAALVKGSAKFSDSAEWKKVLDDFSTLVKGKAYDPKATGIDWPSSATQFATGGAAMLIQGDFAVPAVRTAAATLKMGMFPLPYVASGDPVVSISYGGILAIPSKSAHAAAAKKFLSFLADPAVLGKYLTTAVALSPVDGVTPTLDPAVQEIAPALAKNSSEYSLASGIVPATQAALTSGLQTIMDGSGTTDSVLQAMDRAQTP